MAEFVRAEIGDGVAQLTIDHPPVNVLTRALLGELREHLTALADDSSLRVLLLTASGMHFSAGADVVEHLPPAHRELIPEFVGTIRALWDFPLPVIAGVQGKCLGGGFELVQPADIVIAGRSASFGQPEIALGVFPPAACAILPRLCGPARAAQLVLQGDPLSADEALVAGLVSEVVGDDAVEPAARAAAGRIARHSAAALRVTKRALRAAGEAATTDALARAERIYLEDLMRTRDAIEGLDAFVAKRPPTWEHR